MALNLSTVFSSSGSTLGPMPLLDLTTSSSGDSAVSLSVGVAMNLTTSRVLFDQFGVSRNYVLSSAGSTDQVYVTFTDAVSCAPSKMAAANNVTFGVSVATGRISNLPAADLRSWVAAVLASRTAAYRKSAPANPPSTQVAVCVALSPSGPYWSQSDLAAVNSAAAAWTGASVSAISPTVPTRPSNLSTAALRAVAVVIEPAATATTTSSGLTAAMQREALMERVHTALMLRWAPQTAKAAVAGPTATDLLLLQVRIANWTAARVAGVTADHLEVQAAARPNATGDYDYAVVLVPIGGAVARNATAPTASVAAISRSIYTTVAAAVTRKGAATGELNALLRALGWTALGATGVSESGVPVVNATGVWNVMWGLAGDSSDAAGDPTSLVIPTAEAAFAAAGFVRQTDFTPVAAAAPLSSGALSRFVNAVGGFEVLQPSAAEPQVVYAGSISTTGPMSTFSLILVCTIMPIVAGLVSRLLWLQFFTVKAIETAATSRGNTRYW
jgi:hypothetical protein